MYIFTGRQVNVVSPFLAYVLELLYVVLEYSSEPLFFESRKVDSSGGGDCNINFGVYDRYTKVIVTHSQTLGVQM